MHTQTQGRGKRQGEEEKTISNNKKQICVCVEQIFRNKHTKHFKSGYFWELGFQFLYREKSLHLYNKSTLILYLKK